MDRNFKRPFSGERHGVGEPTNPSTAGWSPKVLRTRGEYESFDSAERHRHGWPWAEPIGRPGGSVSQERGLTIPNAQVVSSTAVRTGCSVICGRDIAPEYAERDRLVGGDHVLDRVPTDSP